MSLEIPKIIKNLNNLGYEVGLNLMQVQEQNELEIIQMLKEIKFWNLKIDHPYFADSLGCMDNNTLRILLLHLQTIGQAGRYTCT